VLQLTAVFGPVIASNLGRRVLVRFGRMTAAEANTRSALALRLALERVGGAFIKFGQILAMRPDFLPAEYVMELVNLLDRVPPFPTDEAIRRIEDDLGQPIDELFESFPAEPVASASFGQVYRASLPTGEVVAVKVQRPGVREVVRSDLRILRAATWLLDTSTLLLTLKLRPLYDDFRRWTLEELDYRVEARYASRMMAANVDTPEEAIPEIYWDLTGEHVLTLEFFDGYWISDVLADLREHDPSVAEAKLAAHGTTREEVAADLLTVMLREAFVGGVFHADPHAANLVVLRDGRIGLVDFGIVGVMISEFQAEMLRFLEHTSDGNASRAFQAVLRIVEVPSAADLRAFRFEYESNLQNWMSAVADPHATIAEKSNTRLLLGNLAVMRRYQVRLPPMVLRYYRAFMIVDTIVLQLCPQLNIMEAMKRVFGEMRLARLLEPLTVDNYVAALLQYQNALLALPRTVDELLNDRLVAFERELTDTPRTARRLAARATSALGTVWLLLALLVAVLGATGQVEAVPSPIRALATWQLLAVAGLVIALVLRWMSRRLRT
jgi:ubiquinone biosynthesis protein